MSSHIPPAVRRAVRAAALSCLLTALAACRVEAERPSPRAVVVPHVAVSAPDAPAPDWTDEVEVAQLIAAAAARHPGRLAIQAGLDAAHARIGMAATWSNPELQLSIGRTRPRVAGLEPDSPIGGSLTQRFSWWGVRDARAAAAMKRADAIAAEAEMASLDLEAEVRRSAAAYATSAAALQQAEDDARIAADLATHAVGMHRSGDAGRAEVARAGLERATAELQRDARRREQATALEVLRIWCGPELPDGLVIRDALALHPALGDALPPHAVSAVHPTLRSLAALSAAADAEADGQRRSRLPEVDIGVFADREADQDTIGVSLGMALPVWDRNEAAIAEAESERRRTRAAARAEHQRLQRALVEAEGAWRAAAAEARSLGSEAIPIAEEAIRLRQAAFQAGEASLVDLLEARRAANAVRAAWRDARLRAVLAQIALGLAVGDLDLVDAAAGDRRP